MTTYYVGSGGNDSNDGLSWANRKLTLNGAEDIPVAAGDTVYVGPGVYREALTVDVSGSSGSPITYIGDYSGDNTDGVGGVVRITGSDNDQTATRSNCINANSKNYRTFEGFILDMCSSNLAIFDSCTNLILRKAHFYATGPGAAVRVTGTSSAVTIEQFYIGGFQYGQGGLWFSHSSTVDDTGHVIQNGIILGSGFGVYIQRIGGITVKNCLFHSNRQCVTTATAALTGGQTTTVNNNIFAFTTGVSLVAVTLGEITENYNTLYALSSAARTNVGTGANSNTYPALPDARWFFEAVGA